MIKRKKDKKKGSKLVPVQKQNSRKSLENSLAEFPKFTYFHKYLKCIKKINKFSVET